MKLKAQATERIPEGNEAAFLQQAALPKGGSSYVPLVQLIAQMCDMIAQGQDIFMIIGATQKKDSLSLTVKFNGEATSVYATNLVGLATQSSTLL